MITNKQIIPVKNFVASGPLVRLHLHKLEGEGFLTVSIEKVRNRDRKYYQLTENGKTEAVHKISDLKEFVIQMQMILKTKLAQQ